MEKIKRPRMPQSEVLERLKITHADIQCEEDREWLWCITEVGPLHQIKGGCQCDECAARAAKREAIKELGFRFSFKPHTLPSGKTSRWANSCLRPTRFPKRKSFATTNKTEVEESDDSEAEAFFNQL